MSGGSRKRLEPLPVGKWSEEARAALRSFVKNAEPMLSGAPGAPRVPNVLGVLMHHPRVTGPWLTYNGVLLNQPTLDPRHRELLILRVAWRTRALYEWLQHVRLARQVGISTAEIEAISSGAAAGTWTPLESDLLAATDQLLDRHRIEDATWRRLGEQLDERQLVELTFVVGSYACLAMAFNSFGIEPDPDLDPAAAPALPEPWR